MDKIIRLLTAFLLCGFFATAQNIDDVAAIWAKVYTPVDSVGLGSRKTLNDNIILKEAGGYWTDTRLPRNGIFNTLNMNLNVEAGTVTAGNIFFEQTSDTTNSANTIAWFVTDNTTASAVSTYTFIAATSRSFSGQIRQRFVRSRINSTVTGTTTGVQMNSTYSTTMAMPPWMTVVSNFDGAFLAKVTHTTSATNNASTVTSYRATATTNGTSLKVTAGNVYSIVACNTSAAIKYVRIYNSSSAPTVGTTVPVTVLAIPATSTASLNFADIGLKFSTGIAYAITGGAPILDATATAVDDVLLTINWQ